MSSKEMTLMRELVRMGFDMEFSRRCDDFDDELLKDFTPEEIAALSAEFSEWNGDPEESDPSRFTRIGMLSAGRFLFDKAFPPPAEAAKGRGEENHE